MMNERGKSDGLIVPEKSPNKGGASDGLFHGDPYTGTKGETLETAKGEPTGRGLNCTSPAEEMEGRGSAKGNSQERSMLRTQGRERVQQALERVRQVAASNKGTRFTALLHPVYNPDTLW